MFAVLITAVSSVLFGLLPSWTLSQSALTRAIRRANVVGRMSPQQLRGLLVSGQVAVALVLLVAAGLTYTRENFTGTELSNALEALASARFDFFRLDPPKTDVMVSLSAYPSLTDFGRLRLEFDARAAHELIEDFTLSLTLFDSFDSRPPSATASKNDFGGTLSLGWTF